MRSYLYAVLIYPIEMLIETVFTVSMKMVPNPGYAVIFVSAAVQLLVLPIYKRADEMQEDERIRQKRMAPMVGHIKETFRGDERVMMLSTYYREEHYHTYYQLRAVLPLLLQIPFFLAAYNFLSNCPALDGAAFYFLKDMGKPDGMLKVGNISINVMPVAMTAINIVSGMIYTRGLGLKDKVQLYITAGVFLVLLYNSPSGLVFYWTLNNVFSLLKNIFMKIIRHPRPIISAASFLLCSAYCYKCRTYGKWEDETGRIVMAGVFLLGMMPAIGMLVDRIRPADEKKAITADETGVFMLSAVVLAITTGVLIPVAVFTSSPTEFVIKGNYVNPLYHTIYPFAVAIGIFVLWGSIFFVFNSGRSRRIMCVSMFILSATALADSQFFKEHLNNMTALMQYNRILEITGKQKLINVAVLTVMAIVCLILYRLSKRMTELVLISVLAVILAMTGYDVYRIQSTLSRTAHIMDDEYYTESDAHFTLDKRGNNVVILFLDRALGPYVPYIFHERPELAEVYSGFTYYPNTISYGPHTLTGGPPIMGGYEYTTYNMKDMTGKDYISFKKSSLGVMPSLFSQKGFKCSILDPMVDLDGETIEDYYHGISPDIDAYHADGVLRSKEDAERDYDHFERIARKTYIRHSIFLESPLFLRMFIYDDGDYNMQEHVDDSMTLRGHIAELDRLEDMTVITDTGRDTFTFIGNETPHSINADLQMPDYTVEDVVNNSPYLKEWRDNLSQTPEAADISMNTEWAIQSYEVNIASFLRVGEWISYLKDIGVYDNTRIILVSDHGFYYFAFDDLMFDKGSGVSDLERLMPILLVKDFGDGSFTTSDQFMTNADVPSLAMEGLIDDPVNPATGKPVTSSQKYDRLQYVFDDQDWLSVHDDIYDLNNWKVESIEYKNKDIVIND